MKKFRQSLVQVYNFIGIFRKEHKNILWVMLLGAVTTAAIPFVNLVFYSLMLNKILQGDYNDSIHYIAIMLVTVFVLGIVSRACKQAFYVIQQISSETVERKTIKKSYEMEYEELEKTETLDSIRRVKEGSIGSGGVDAQLESIQKLMEQVVQILFACGFVALLFTKGKSGEKNFFTSWIAVVVLLAIYAIIFYTNYRLGKISSEKCNEMRRKNEHNNSVGGYMINLILNNKNGKEIRIYGMKDYLMKMYRKYHIEAFDMYLRWGKTQGKYSGMMAFLAQMSAALAYLFVGAKAIYGNIEIGDVLMYVGAINCLTQGIQNFMSEYNNMIYRMDYLKTYEEFINRTNMHYTGTLPIEKRDDARYEIEFCDVSFRYPETEQYVLEHVNLKFVIGDKVAVVGRNGAGKSTLIKLLCRLYEPTSGKILLNGIDIGFYDYAEYVQIFSVVFQDFKLFSFPIDENVAAGANVEESRLWNVLDQVGMKEKVEGMPKQLRTKLYKNNGEGVVISGGEAQKLAIARALYKDGPFIILDEPTAALDPYAEAEIYENFNKMIGNKTAIFISHRMSSCKFCDDIIVLDQGRIAERGNHDTLLKKNGIYTKLYETQAQYYEETKSAS